MAGRILGRLLFMGGLLMDLTAEVSRSVSATEAGESEGLLLLTFSVILAMGDTVRLDMGICRSYVEAKARE